MTLGRVFFERGVEVAQFAVVDVLEGFFHVGFGNTEGTQQGGDGDLALAVDLDIQCTVGSGLKFQPSTTARDNLGTIQSWLHRAGRP